MTPTDTLARFKQATDSLPGRDVEGEAMAAWIAVDRLTTAEPDELRQNVRAIVEMREKLDAMIGLTKAQCDALGGAL